MEKLILIEKSRNANQVVANIVSSPRANNLIFHTGYLTIASCAVPEYTGDCLYIWGTETTRDAEEVEIDLEAWPKVLCSIDEFNAAHEKKSAFATIASTLGYVVCCNHYWLNKNDCFCQRMVCDICGKEHPKETMRAVPYNNGASFKYICMEHKKTKACPVCGTKDYMLFRHKNYSIEVCSSCQETELAWKEQLNYSYKPEPIFYDYDIKSQKIIKHSASKVNKNPSLNTKFWMGHEVEQQYQATMIRELVIGEMDKELGDILYCKSDSSIGSYGTEAVTHPFSWEYFKKVGLKGILNKHLFNWRESDNQVGHHVHMNNSAFSKLHLYRFLKFHHTHLNWVEFISQRKLAHYCKSTGGSLTKAFHKKGRDRYEFINLQNGKTVEWRAFASPMSYEEFCKNTEYLYAAYIWTKENSNQELFSQNFEDFINKQYKHFPNIYNFIEENKDKTRLARERHIINREESYENFSSPRRQTLSAAYPSAFTQAVASGSVRVCCSCNTSYTHISSHGDIFDSESGELNNLCPACRVVATTFVCSVCDSTCIGTSYTVDNNLLSCGCCYHNDGCDDEEYECSWDEEDE